MFTAAMDTLARIKRLVIARRVLFTEKAELEMASDALTAELVYEAMPIPRARS